MKKSDFIELVKTTGGFATKTEAEKALTSVLESLSVAFKKGEPVQLTGFGTFTVKERAAREGRNPKTGEAVQIEASRSVAFKAGKALKAELN